MSFSKRALCLILAIIIVLSFGSAFSMSGASSYIYGNTASNISNYGLISEAGGYIYFSNTADSGKLYRMKPDGTSYSKICDDKVQYINVINDTVYYSNLSDNGYLYSVKTNGTNRIKLVSENSAYITVVSNVIYYVSITDNWKMKKCALNGTGIGYLGSGIRGYNLNISEGYAYYINLADGFIYKMTISTGATAAINKEKAYQFVVYEDYVFYINVARNRVFRLNVTGASSQTPKLYTTYKCAHLAVYNDIVYFSMETGISGEAKGGIIGSIKISDVNSDTDVSGIYGACLNGASGNMYFCNIYENSGSFVYYSNMHRITYDGKKTDSISDLTGAAAVMSAIDALPSADKVTSANKDAIVNARKSYDGLNAAQKAFVLAAHVAKLSALEAALGVEGPSSMVSGVYKFDRTAKTVFGIAENSSVATVKGNLAGNNSGGVIKIYNASNAEVTTGNVGTGFKAKLIYKDRVVEEFSVLIVGDVNGDGKMSSLDMLRIQRHILKYTTITGVYLAAADSNKDSKVSSLDMLRIQRHILKYITIVQ